MKHTLANSVEQKRIGFVGFEGVTASHLTGPADAFSAAALDDGFGNRIACYEVCIVGLNREPFHSDSGLTFQPQYTLRNAPQFDVIVIPGGRGLRAAGVSETIADWVLKNVERTHRIASICTGIYGLAPTGLLDGRQVTTHWRVATDVARRFPKLSVNYKRLVVKDGPFYTSTGLTAGIDLSLALIEEDFGRHVAHAAALELVTPLHRREAEPVTAVIPISESAPSDRFGELVAWIMRHLDSDLSVETLARRACISQRHFSRAFKSVFGTSPSEFVENLRLNEARRRLSTRQKTLHSVAASVGFKNATAFHRAFEKRFGMRPSRSPGASARFEEPVAKLSVVGD